jgi:hypothetical protein
LVTAAPLQACDHKIKAKQDTSAPRQSPRSPFIQRISDGRGSAVELNVGTGNHPTEPLVAFAARQVFAFHVVATLVVVGEQEMKKRSRRRRYLRLPTSKVDPRHDLPCGRIKRAS